MNYLIHRFRLVVVTVTGLVFIGQSWAASGDVPYPNIPQVPESKAKHCVEPTEVMRRHHMDFILHQRDETMHLGIRTKKYSLSECISCHVNPDANGEYPRISSNQHFCAACHTYTSVTIDCFQCHADVPEPSESTSVTQQNQSHLPTKALSDSQVSFGKLHRPLTAEFTEVKPQ
jgi:hypothetical protein